MGIGADDIPVTQARLVRNVESAREKPDFPIAFYSAPEGALWENLMTVRSIAVFFYGLFMDAELLRAKGANPRAVEPASVNGFSIRIGQRATLVPDSEGRVHGMLRELSHEDIDRLYAEPGVQMYRPEAMLCETADGRLVPAVSFTLPQPPEATERNENYAEQLRALCRRLGLPTAYIDSIQ